MKKKAILFSIIIALCVVYSVLLGAFLTMHSRTALLGAVLCFFPAAVMCFLLYRKLLTAHANTSRLRAFTNDFIETEKKEIDRLFPHITEEAPVTELSMIFAQVLEKLQSLDSVSFKAGFQDLMGEWSVLQKSLQRVLPKVLFMEETIEATKETYGEELTAIKEQLASLCSIHLPIDITSEWNSRIEKNWNNLSTESLESLSHIKEMQNSSSQFIEEMVKKFEIQQDSYRSYSDTYQKTLKTYFDRVERIRSDYVRDLDTTSVQIRNTFALFNQIADIVERIKLISLNMSIEASKVKGSDAFSFLARELRRLAEYTEGSIKNITQRIEGTLKEVDASREKQIHEFGDMMGIIEQFKQISIQYDETTGTLTQYIQKAITKIEDNQKEEKTILMLFFKNLQDITIQKEELNHIIQYQRKFLRRANDIVQHIVRDSQICRGVSCPDREAALEELSAMITTNTERIFVKELYRNLLGRDLEESQEQVNTTDEGIILF